MPDLLIAAPAELAGLVVLHDDKDFDLIASATGQAVERRTLHPQQRVFRRPEREARLPALRPNVVFSDILWPQRGLHAEEARAFLRALDSGFATVDDAGYVQVFGTRSAMPLAPDRQVRGVNDRRQVEMATPPPGQVTSRRMPRHAGIDTCRSCTRPAGGWPGLDSPGPGPAGAPQSWP